MNQYSAKPSDILLSYHNFTEFNSSRTMSHALEFVDISEADPTSLNGTPTLFEQNGSFLESDDLDDNNETYLGGDQIPLKLQKKCYTQDGYFEDFITRLKNMCLNTSRAIKDNVQSAESPTRVQSKNDFSLFLKKNASGGRTLSSEIKNTSSGAGVNALLFAWDELDDSDDDIYTERFDSDIDIVPYIPDKVIPKSANMRSVESLAHISKPKSLTKFLKPKIK